jgi:hypothetical protein
MASTRCKTSSTESLLRKVPANFDRRRIIIRLSRPESPAIFDRPDGARKDQMAQNNSLLFNAVAEAIGDRRLNQGQNAL